MIDLSAHWVEGLQVRYAAPVAPPAVQYYRQPHDRELRLADVKADVTRTDRVYRGAATGSARQSAIDSGKTIPEVFQLLPSFGRTELSPAWVDFVCNLNYGLPRDKAMLIFDPHWAFNNNGTTPAFDKPRLCGGALLRGTVNGSNLMIDGLLTSDPVPDARDVLAKPWLWYYGVAVAPNGNVSYMSLGVGSGVRIPIRVPILNKMPVYLPLAWLHRLPPDYDPATHDALRFW